MHSIILRIPVIILLCFFGKIDFVHCQSLDALAEKALVLLDTTADPDQKRSLWQDMPNHMAFLGQQDYNYTDLITALPMLMITLSSDSALIFVTGEARLDKDFFQYYGGTYLIKKKKWISFNPLEPAVIPAPETIYTQNEWAGRLYYDARKFRKGFKNYYIVMGYRYVDYFRREKTMEIISVDGEGVEFGISLIKGPKDDRWGRFSLEYAAEAPVFFNYDPVEKKIVFDHLIPFKGIYEGQGTVWVPDGSYSAFEWKKGFWQYLEKLPVLYSETPPGSQPAQRESDKRDILGRPLGKN